MFGVSVYSHANGFVSYIVGSNIKKAKMLIKSWKSRTPI